MLRLLVASGNPKKLIELEALVQGLPVQLVSPRSLGAPLPEVEEDGATFEENAAKKARAFAAAAGLPCIADDSGLCVDALGGAPGVFSARYSGPQGAPGRDEANNRKLLQALLEVPPGRRGAHFTCALALAWPDGRVQTVLGRWDGAIAFSPRGAHGFGYDPLFLLPAHGATSAELPSERKNRLSHRARAMAALRPIVEALASGVRDGGP